MIFFNFLKLYYSDRFLLILNIHAIYIVNIFSKVIYIMYGITDNYIKKVDLIK